MSLYNVWYRKGGCNNFEWVQYLDSRYGNHADFTPEQVESLVPDLMEHGHCFIVQPIAEDKPVLFMPQNAIDGAFDLPNLL